MFKAFLGRMIWYWTSILFKPLISSLLKRYFFLIDQTFWWPGSPFLENSDKYLIIFREPLRYSRFHCTQLESLFWVSSDGSKNALLIQSDCSHELKYSPSSTFRFSPGCPLLPRLSPTSSQSSFCPRTQTLWSLWRERGWDRCCPHECCFHNGIVHSHNNTRHLRPEPPLGSSTL